MRVYNVRNVNHVFNRALKDIQHAGVPRPSRAGPVLEFPEPVATTYSKPTQRVLFHEARKANHFFHFMEGLWIIAGREDVAFLDLFNTQMKQYSDDGKTFYGAYGHRLRKTHGCDQIELAIAKLRANPDDRRVALAMWDPVMDLATAGAKDHPCNTHIYLKVRNKHLDMTVCCRSNDLIYGCYGANVVHMSMLQEYLAGMIGVKVGIYTQVSDSLHVYTDLPLWKELKDDTTYFVDDPYEAEYPEHFVEPYPMFGGLMTVDEFHNDLERFLDAPFVNWHYKTGFFQHVAKPMALAWARHKEYGTGLDIVDDIMATDWRKACRQWLAARENV